MNRVLFLLPILIITSLTGFSQDTIFKTDNTLIISKVIEVQQQVIKYKKFDNPDGPIYTLGLGEIFKIVYANGSEEVYIIPIEDQEARSKKRAQMIIQVGPSFATYLGDVESTQQSVGFAGGISIEIPLNPKNNDCFDLCLLYEQKGSRYDDQNTEQGNVVYEVSEIKESLEYITLAMAYKRYFGESELIFARLGLYGGFLYEATGSGNFKSTDTGIAKDLSLSIKDYYTTIDFGATIGLGFKIPLQEGKFQSDLILDLRYNVSLSDINDTTEDSEAYGIKILNSDLVFMAGIRFPF